MWIGRDLKHAARALRNTLTSTVVAVLSLALGIGSTTAIFCLINALVIRPLPVDRPEQLVSLGTSGPSLSDSKDRLSLAMFKAIRRDQRVFSGLFLWDAGGMETFEAKGESYAGSIEVVSGDYFSTLRIRPFLGRLITPEDVNLNSASSAPVAVLGYGSWKNRFQGDPRAIDTIIRVNGKPLKIIGVCPESFHGLMIDVAPEAVVPIGYSGTGKRFNAEKTEFAVTGRLQDGENVQRVRAQLESLWPSVRESSIPLSYKGSQREDFLKRRLVVEPSATGTSWMRQRMSRPLRLLMYLSALVLVIACLNLANLMLARATARQHEMGIRVALGAGTWSLVRQSLTESILISIAGAVIGFLFAIWASRLLIQTAWTGYVATSINPAPDFLVFAFTAAVALITGVLFGTMPAGTLRQSNTSGIIGMRTRSIRSGPGRFGFVLVSLQFAISLVLVVGAALFVRSLQLLNHADSGFSRDGVLVMQLLLKPGVSKIPDRSVYYRELAGRLSRVPGVEVASYSQNGPISRSQAKESVLADTGAPAEAVFEIAGPGFFDVLRMRILEGRQFAWRDDETSKKVVVVSQSLAKDLFQSRSAIGHHIRIGLAAEQRDVEIVGVVNDASLWVPQSRPPMAFYLPLLQEPDYNDTTIDLRLRSSGSLSSLAPTLRREVSALGKQYPLSIDLLTSRFDKVLVQERIIAALAAFFGPLALILASIGLYGLVSYTVIGRTPELGIRMALGSSRRDVIWIILKQVLLIAASGIAIGVPIALAVTHLLAGMIFGVKPNDPGTISLAVVALLATTLLAGYIPARRAATIDPMTTLRTE